MKGSRVDAVLAGVSALVPACLIAWHAGNVADAAHDAGVARVLGLDPQPWRALDVVIGTLLSAVPVGTRAARAALGGALVAAVAGAVLYRLARGLLATCAETRELRFFVAAIAALSPLVAAPWQIESAAVGGSVTGALLVLAPVALLAEGASWLAVALALGLSIGHEPLVGACACAGSGVFVGSSPGARASLTVAWREQRASLLAAGFAGLAPLALALARARAGGGPLASTLAIEWAGERGLSHGGSPWPFVASEMGVVLALLVAGGCILAMLVPAARPLASALAIVAALGFACAWLGAPVGPTRYGAPVLAAFAAACVLAGVAMQALVRAIASARVPMARASAAMVVILELALPADLADEGMTRSSLRATSAASAWDDAAWALLPPRTVVLVTDAAIYARALAARAGGDLRDDVTLVPTFLHDPRGWRPLADDPALVPLWRDLELVGAPGEASLSSLAAARPLAMSYVPAWGKSLGKHLVAATLFDRFEPEPRGASDRRHALDAFGPIRDRLAPAVAGDPELRAAAALLLRARARLVTDLSADPDLATRTAADVQAFAPRDGRD